MIASDIHGDAVCCETMIERFKEEKADKLLLLGDILYHGPRNDLPEHYLPKKVIELLNEYRDLIYCVRGNCDGEVDQMVLDFPILADFMPMYIDGILFMVTHGHKFNPENPVSRTDKIMLCGHTHVPACEEREGILYLNPGSVALPKNGTPKSYMIYEDRCLLWKDLNTKEVFMKHEL